MHNIENEINTARNMFCISPDSSVRVILITHDKISFQYLNNCDSVQAGWLRWGEIMRSYSYNGIDVYEEVRNELEKKYKDDLSELTIDLFEYTELKYKTAWVPELSILAIKIL
jgi:hypothetical protein